MEQGEVKNYTETEKLDRIRRANAQRHVTNTSEEVSNFQKKANLKYLLALTTTKARACIKSHMTPKVSIIDTFVLTVFNNLAKPTHIQNKIAGIRLRN